MNKLRRLRSLSPEMAETLRLAGVQGIFWAAMAVGNYQTVYLQSIGFPATDFGLLNAIACAVAIFAMTFWGTVSDRIGSVRKIVILTLTLGCGLFIFVPLIPTGQSYSTLLFLILIPIINFFRVPMSPFVDNLTVRNCAEHRLNYGMVRSSGSLLFAIAGVITVNALIPAAGVPSTFGVMGIVMIPAIVLTYFCFEPQSGKRVKKSAAGAGVLLKNYAYMAFLIFAFFFQMAVAFEANFLTYYMADIQIDTVNLGLILSVRAMMEIPFLFFIGRLRRYIKMKYLIMLSAILMATECLCFCFLVNSLPTMLVFAAFYGLGNGAFLGTGTNYIYELAPVELRATAHSLFISVAQISGILGNLLGGVLFDTIGGKAFYGVTACVFLVSVAIFAASFLFHRNKKETAVA